MGWFLERLRSFGDRPALTHGETAWSYATLAARAEACLVALRTEDVDPADVVAIVSDYSPLAIATFLALHENRSTLVPITTLIEDEARSRLEEGHVERAVRLESGRVAVSDGPARGKPKPPLLESLAVARTSGLVLFSSGSTGRPKAMVQDLDALVDRFKDKRAKQLNILVFLMFDHIGGLNTLLGALATGSHVVIPESRDPEVIAALIARHAIHVLPASPTFLNLLLMAGAAERHDLSSLRMITYGTEPMPDAVLARARAAFPKARFHQTFGTSETGIAQTASRSSDSTFLRIDDPDQEHTIVDGELWLRSKTQIRGYLNASMEAFTEDGWFRTGDLVEQADDGFLRIVGRLKEMINVGGEKVLPAEVEAAMADVPHVVDCIVYGAPNAITGQTVAAKVVLDAPVEPRALRMAVREHLKDRLAAYKIPTKIEVVERTFGDRFKKLRAQH